MNITSPYNFVPLNKQVFYPDWAEQASQDLPLKDGLDVSLDIKMTNVSPLFTRNGSKDGKDPFSAHVIGEDGKRHYFIPATTIKGMLREIVEIMTFGKMQEGKDYQNRYFGYRDVAGRSGKTKNSEYMHKVGMGKPGWLSKNGNNYYFTPCFGELDKIAIGELKQRCPSYQSDPSIWKSNVSVGKNGIYPSYPEIEKNGNYYRIVCTGKIGGKLHELLFPSSEDEPILLKKETMEAFTTMFDATPGFSDAKDGESCFLSALENGEKIPVFYLKLEEGKETLGFSRMFKLPFKYNVKQQVEYLQKADKDKPDFAEALFGYTGKEAASLKGRVQVSHAFMVGEVADAELIEQSGILGTPKASYYPIYLKQHHSPYKTYDENEGIAGRKLYRIHSKGAITGLPQGENKNVGTTFKALPQGQTFLFRITMHNVKEVELGAILAALTFNHTPGVFFNIGMAKSFGFGKCKMGENDIKLNGTPESIDHYLNVFEKNMSSFTFENCQQLWAQTESITQLVNILGEHDDSEVKMMEMKEYGDSKFEKRNPFNQLKEKGTPIHSMLTEEDKEEVKQLALNAKGERAEKEARKSLAKEYEQAKASLDTKDFSKAKSIYNSIIDELLKKGINIQEETRIIDEIDAKIAQLEEEAKQQAAQAALMEQANKLAAGLGATLDKLAGDGVSFSIKDFKVCFQKVEKWLKDSKEEKLSESDANDLYTTAVRLLKEPSKKEVKELGKPFDKSGIWRKLTTFLDETKAKELYETYSK